MTHTQTIRLAEKLMNWLHCDSIDRLDHGGRFAVAGDKILIHGPRFTLREWNPLTNRADALEVLEKCAEKCCVTVEYTAKNSAGNPQFMVAQLVGQDGSPPDLWEENCQCAPTLNEAICLFALKLIEAK